MDFLLLYALLSSFGWPWQYFSGVAIFDGSDPTIHRPNNIWNSMWKTIYKIIHWLTKCGTQQNQIRFTQLFAYGNRLLDSIGLKLLLSVPSILIDRLLSYIFSIFMRIDARTKQLTSKPWRNERFRAAVYPLLFICFDFIWWILWEKWLKCWKMVVKMIKFVKIYVEINGNPEFLRRKSINISFIEKFFKTPPKHWTSYIRWRMN